MISVHEASEIIDAEVKKQSLRSEKILIEKSVGRVLAKDLVATRSQPPFDRVAMDGIAFSSEGLKKVFVNQDIQGAGERPKELKGIDYCIEVMTGASLPIGADIVVPYEKLEVTEKTCRILDEFYSETLLEKRNIHFRGKDYSKGEQLLKVGTLIRSSEISLMASNGLSHVEVFKNPRIAIVATGDELVLPGKEIEDWKIYMSNTFAIKAELLGLGLIEDEIELFHLNDSRDEIKNGLENYLEIFDIIILSGGISAGKFDYVPEVLKELKIKVHFKKVKQKPGKPFLFGTKNDGLIFALPGNPVASIVCTRRYISRAFNTLYKTAKFPRSFSKNLLEKIEIKNDFTRFTLVKKELSLEGLVSFCKITGNGSGDFYSLKDSSGFVEISEKSDQIVYFPWGEF